MIPEFEQLAHKIDQMAAVIHSTRTENDDLRQQINDLVATNADLTERIKQAYERVSLVLNKLPFAEETT